MDQQDERKKYSCTTYIHTLLSGKMETISRSLNTVMCRLDVLLPMYEEQKKVIDSFHSLNAKVISLLTYFFLKNAPSFEAREAHQY